VGDSAGHGGDADDDHEQRGEPHVQHVEQHDGEQDVEQAEQAARGDDPDREAGIPAEGLSLHACDGTHAR
jgi:hypothetical protein